MAIEGIASFDILGPEQMAGYIVSSAKNANDEKVLLRVLSFFYRPRLTIRKWGEVIFHQVINESEVK
ncbi:hypothetical protein PSKAS_04240 [Peribacillus sp. N1]